MRIVRKKLNRWDDKMNRNLRRATLQYGYMRKAVRAFPKSRTIVIFSKKQIMGWALAICHDGKTTVNLFVNRRYRKQGLATILVRSMLRDFPVISLGEWDSVTRKFFRSLRKRYPERIVVFNWWKRYGDYEEMLQKALAQKR